MFGRKYVINPQTLRYEEAKMPLNKRIILGVVAAVIIVAGAVGMRMLYDQNAKSPRLVYYEKKNQELREAYTALSNDLNYDEQILSDLRRRDDRMYRSFFEMEPLPASIREAGTGGAIMHPALRSVSDPNLMIDVARRIDKIQTKAKIQYSSFEDLEEAAVNNRILLASKPLIQPISPGDPYWLTSTFGYRPDPFTKRRKLHHGIDLAGRYGTEIHATGNGVVTIAMNNRRSGYGKEVVIEHEFGYSSRYAHLQDILVQPGDTVRRGQVIGTLGNSGRSTGPHLHYEVRQDNRAINPMYFFYEELSPAEYELIANRALKK